jgi:hypothetical protein
MLMDIEMKIDGKIRTKMKHIAPVIALSALVAALPFGAIAQGNMWNTNEGTQTQYAPTAPVASPYAPANLEQQLSSGGTWPQETQQEYVQPSVDAGPQFAPLEQEIPAPQYGQQQQQFAPMQQQQFMQQQQYAPMQQFMGQQPYYGNVPYGNYGNYGGYVPNYAYGGYPNVGGYPGAYGGYPFTNGYNSIPYGYGTQSPFSNGFTGFPFNNGGFGNQYGNIPSGTSPFFGGGSSPFGFW